MQLYLFLQDGVVDSLNPKPYSWPFDPDLSMYHTPPPKMVLTRSANKNVVSANLHPDGVEPHPKNSVKSEPVKSQVHLDEQLFQPSGSAMGVSTQHESSSQPTQPLKQLPSRDTQYGAVRRDVKNSQVSTSSSAKARRKRLQLEAAEQKARIQMELIDKRLEADLADLEDEYSPLEGDRESERTRTEVEKWLEKSQHEMETAQPAPADGPTSGALDPLHGTVEMLATALKQITTSAANNTSNTQLLTRMSVPKDLPEFYGDPLEWLQFKQAYEESTNICGFSDLENIWRLRKCLRGAARDAVSALLICATSPDQLISTLELRFGNPDMILFKITQELKKLHPLSPDYQNEIVAFSVKIQNYVTAVRAVGREECLRGVHLSNIILSKLPTILISKWSDYSFPKLKDGNNKSRIDILSEFLRKEAIQISTTANIHTMGMRSYQNRFTTRESHVKGSHAVLIQSTKDREEMCNFCKKNSHELPKCKKFLKALRKDRWRYVKRNGLCYKCLSSRHDRETCPAPACDKDNCNGGHHRLLHNPVRRDHDAPSAEEEASAASRAPPVQTIAHLSVTDKKVLLKVVPVKVRGPNGVVSACALLDDGSTISLISEQLAVRAGLRGRAETMSVRGAWNKDTYTCNSTVVTIGLSSMYSNDLFTIKARSVKELNLPVQNVCMSECNKYNHLKNVKIDCDSICKPEILIGQDNYHLLVPLEVNVGMVNEPSATRTPLGWCVHGVMRASPRAAKAPHANLLLAEAAPAPPTDHALHELHEEVRRSFAIDALGVSGKPRQNKDEARAVAALENSAQLIDGRWHVGLPWKDPDCKLPDSYPCALSRLYNLNKKFAANEVYASKYGMRIKHLLSNDFAKQVPNSEPAPRTWYLPHFGVDNPNKKKLRLVFDAAAKVQGKSLNDYLLTGPDLLNSLFGIMLRFRENKVGVAGDIKDMFLRIKIKSEDQNALRFLWKDRPDGDVKTYVMTSLIFGANCSPFIAQFIKNKNALLHASSQPAAVDAILTQHYMDDYIDSLPDDITAIETIKSVTDIHKQGGFEITNWTSNSLSVLSSVPKETLGDAAVRFTIDRQFCGERTLGMMWYPAQDELGFDVSLKRIPEDIRQGKRRPTKRVMLAVVMSIFDVYGLLTPFTIQGKIMLQDVWKDNIGWDDVISDIVYEKWCSWINRLQQVGNVRIPRCYLHSTGATRTTPASAACATGTEHKPATGSLRTVALPAAPPPPLQQPYTGGGSATEFATTTSATTSTDSSNKVRYNNLQLHVFSDASSKSMCAVAYYRWIDKGTANVAFVAAKGRVAPLKQTTIPRLELQAALYAARLADNVSREHKLKISKRYFWCDSTTVLHWIKNDARNYKTFVAARLGEIDDLTKPTEWRYVPTKLNIADVGTRETYDVNVFNNEWFAGPSFLFHVESCWPCDVISYQIDKGCESVMEHINFIQEEFNNLPVPDAERFSSWLRLVRSTAKVLRFIDRCRKKTCTVLMEMETAEYLLIKQAQMECFAAEISALRKGKTIDRSSRLLTLSPILDEHGVLRCGGRIDSVRGVSPETKRPIILDGKHQVARLIAKHYHEKAAHGNHEAVVNGLKQRYWLLKIRPTVKYVVSRCMFCKIRKARPQIPRMGDLPVARMAHHQRPFTYCGVDLFGPMSVAVGRRHEKRYGVIFTCLTIRAVHIEIVHFISTDSLIMALRRMAARRGWPRHIMSDNGTNLRGADTELKRSLLELDNGALRDEAANNAAEWSFIPPLSPHWGGAWERLIRSVKTSLRVILKERAPKDEVLSTLLLEVENIVNSRPLSHVSVEPDSEEALTPNHFLLGTPSSMPTLGKFDNSDLYLRKQWRKAQRLADMFWKRWLVEVLPDLIPRRKWNQEQEPLKVGDLVLLVDPGAPRNVWPRGIIQQVFPGADGRVRVVELRTKTGVLRRSAARVARIPLVQECELRTGVGNVSNALIDP